MSPEEFEQLLDLVATQLTSECLERPFQASKPFENRVRETVESVGEAVGVQVNYNPHPYAFPDISLGRFGVEVKFTTSDSWRSVANSVFETFRDSQTEVIYVMYGKMGGVPAVRWARYSDCVIHVRTSHVPRFELDIDATRSLFDLMGVAYSEFSSLPMERKMEHIRAYARGRLKPGERLWWLEDRPDQGHSLPVQVRLFIDLPAHEKRQLRAEAVLLVPRIVGPGTSRYKYSDVAQYLMIYHGVLAHQTRDLFSAGSVALRADSTRGGIYVNRSISDLEREIEAAALRLPDQLFVEYWGESVKPEDRIDRWLEMADEHARHWIPSEVLFTKRSSRTD